MVPEDDERLPQSAEQPDERRNPTWMGDQVSRDAHEVGVACRDPVDRPLGGDATARRRAEVEVRQVPDPKAVELGRQALDLHLEHAKA